MSDKKKKEPKYSRLTGLGSERLAEVDHKILLGAKAKEIADLILNDYGMYGGEIESGALKYTTLVRQIDRYRKKELLPKAKLSTLVADKPTIEVITKKKSSLDSMYEVADLQLARVLEFRQQELNMVEDTKKNKTPKIVGLSGYNKAVGVELKIYSEILKNVAALELEIGVVRRAPKVVAGILIDADSDKTRKEFERRVSQRKEVHNLMPALIAALSGEE